MLKEINKNRIKGGRGVGGRGGINDNVLFRSYERSGLVYMFRMFGDLVFYYFYQP